MTISASIVDNVMRYEVEVLVVNKGRRIARINEVCIPAEHFRWILFNTERNAPFDLEEGQAQVFRQRVMSARA